MAYRNDEIKKAVDILNQTVSQLKGDFKTLLTIVEAMETIDKELLRSGGAENGDIPENIPRIVRSG